MREIEVVDDAGVGMPITLTPSWVLECIVNGSRVHPETDSEALSVGQVIAAQLLRERSQ